MVMAARQVVRYVDILIDFIFWIDIFLNFVSRCLLLHLLEFCKSVLVAARLLHALVPSHTRVLLACCCLLVH